MAPPTYYVLTLVLLVLIEILHIASAPVFCPEAPNNPQDRRSNLYNLRVTAINPEWLFLVKPDEGSKNCPGSGCKWRNQQEAVQHLEVFAGILEKLDADIVTLPEIEDCYVLEQLIELLPGMNYEPYVLRGTDTATGQNVGLLTRVDPVQDLQRSSLRVDFPVSGNRCGYNGAPGTQTVSKHFWTRIHLNGANVNLFLLGLHFLAYPIEPDRCAKRESQAIVIEDILNNEPYSGDEIIVLGDFNDYQHDLLDTAGSIPTSRVMRIISEARSLYNVAHFRSGTRNQLYSCWWDKFNRCYDSGGEEHTLIDHILISPGLRPAMTSMSFDHSYEASCDSYASDHWPIVVDFDFTRYNHRNTSNTRNK